MENRIKELRQKNNMSQIRLSIELEVSQETVSAYENGKYYPSFQTLYRMANIFHTSIDYLMGLTDTENIAESITSDEMKILQIFRNLKMSEQDLARAYLQGLSDASSNN